MKIFSINALDWIWLLLLLATGFTFWLGESGTTSQHGSLAAMLMFAIVIIKGWLVADHFMELRHAPGFWRWGVLGWLLFVCLLILLAYWLATVLGAPRH